MAITFPNSPSSGDTHTTSNGLQYTYDGEKWTTIGTNSAGTWTRTGTTVSLTTAGDDLNVDSGTLFVDASTNNVGVGTTSPGSYSAYANNLVVNEAGNAGISISSTDSGSNVSSIQFTGGTTRRHYIECTNGSNGNFTFQTGGTGAFRFIDGSGERVRIDGSGNVGIGTSSPQAKFEVAGDAVIGTDNVALVEFTNTGVPYFAVAADASNYRSTRINVVSSGGYADLSFDAMGTAPKTGLPSAGTLVRNILYLDASTGNVGIGTTSVDELLHLKGASAASTTLKVESTATASERSSIHFFNGTVSRGRVGGSNDFDGLTLDSSTTESAAVIRFRTGGASLTEKMRIDSSGRLLVGTSSSRSISGLSSQRLQIEGTDGTGSCLSIINNQNSVGRGSIRFGKSRGTSLGSNTIVANGDSLGDITWSGADGTDLASDAASIKCEIDGTPGSNDMPGRLVFFTTADSASSPTERLRIDSTGRLLVGSGAISTPKVNTGGIDISTHNIAIVFGGSSLSGTNTLRANNATKDGRIAAAHYSNTEEPVGVVRVISSSTENQLHWGGGSSIINAATDHRFYTASNNTTSGGFERMRIQSGGGISFNGDTATANALDDYEEGTWTPGAANNSTGSLSNSTGKYVKIGKLVFCTINFSGSGFGGSNVVSISGLPFTHGGTSNDPAFSFNDCGHTIGIGNSANNPRLRMHGSYLQGVESLGSTTYLTWTELGGGSGTLEFRGSFTYITS